MALRITPHDARELAASLRRVDVAAEDVNTVMDAADALVAIADEVVKVAKNRDRIMRNRMNKQIELADLRRKVGEIHALVHDMPVDDNTSSIIRNILTSTSE